MPVLPVAIISNDTTSQLEEFLHRVREPFLFKGADLGGCTKIWTPEYLGQNVGKQNVKVHVSSSTKLDFLNRNFCYRSLPFNELIKRASEKVHNEGEYFISDTELYYLRSLGEDVRRDRADIQRQFPSLTRDIIFPSWIPQDRFFSSVFRVSSPELTLWTHYDVMDNVLIQVNGRKRAVLFPPSDVPYLYLKGDKSAVLNIDEPDLEQFPEFSKCTRYECIMEQGDILYIPALWFHNMTSLQFGVAVNVFWKHLDDIFYDPKDPYGNKDYLPASQAFLFVDKAVRALEKFPHDLYKEFYTQQIISKLNLYLETCKISKK